MDLDFTGKVALITGAGNGIGRATALAFAKSGAKIVVVDRDTTGGEATAGIIRQQGGEAEEVVTRLHWRTITSGAWPLRKILMVLTSPASATPRSLEAAASA